MATTGSKGNATLNASFLKELLHGRPAGHKKNKDFDPDQYAEQIIKQELGNGASFAGHFNTVNKKKKKKRPKHQKRAFVAVGSIEKAETSFLHSNNLHDYSERCALQRADLEMLERQYPAVLDGSLKAVTTVADTIEQLVGEDKELRPEDLAIASQYLATTDEENIGVYEEWQRRFARGVFISPTSSPSSSRPVSSSSNAHENVDENENPNGELTTIKTEKRARVIHAAKSMMLMNKLVMFVGHRLGYVSTWQDAYEQMIFRRQHFEAQNQNSHLFPAPVVSNASFLEQLHATMSQSQFQSNQQSASVYSTTNSSSIMTGNNEPDMMSMTMTGGEPPSTGNNSARLPPLHLSSTHNNNNNKSSVLPAKHPQHGGHGAKHASMIDTKKFGYDTSFSRPTPRVLHYSQSSSRIPDIQALRHELEAAQLGVQELNKRVDANIAWVQENCDISQYAAHLSDRTKFKVKKMATQRILTVLANWAQRRLFWALHALRQHHFYQIARDRSSKYCRLKAVHVFGRVLIRNYLKLTFYRLTKWLKFVRVRIQLEKEAAAVEIQRIARGKLARIRVRNIELGRTAVVIQNLFRKTRASLEVQEKKIFKAQRINGTAALLLQKYFRDLVAIRKAKREVAERRAKKAATNIQKIMRGKLERSSVNEKLRLKAIADIEKLKLKQDGTDLDALAAKSSTTTSAKHPSPPRNPLRQQRGAQTSSSSSSSSSSSKKKANATAASSKKQTTAQKAMKNNYERQIASLTAANLAQHQLETAEESSSIATRSTEAEREQDLDTNADVDTNADTNADVDANANIDAEMSLPHDSVPMSSQRETPLAQSQPVSARSSNSAHSQTSSNHGTNAATVIMNHRNHSKSASRSSSRPSSTSSSRFASPADREGRSDSFRSTGSRTTRSRTMRGATATTTTKESDNGDEDDNEDDITDDAALRIQTVARGKLAKKKVEQSRKMMKQHEQGKGASGNSSSSSRRKGPRADGEGISRTNSRDVPSSSAAAVADSGVTSASASIAASSRVPSTDEGDQQQTAAGSGAGSGAPSRQQSDLAREYDDDSGGGGHAPPLTIEVPASSAQPQSHDQQHQQEEKESAAAVAAQQNTLDTAEDSLAGEHLLLLESATPGKATASATDEQQQQQQQDEPHRRSRSTPNPVSKPMTAGSEKRSSSPLRSLSFMLGNLMDSVRLGSAGATSTPPASSSSSSKRRGTAAAAAAAAAAAGASPSPVLSLSLSPSQKPGSSSGFGGFFQALSSKLTPGKPSSSSSSFSSPAAAMSAAAENEAAQDGEFAAENHDDEHDDDHDDDAGGADASSQVVDEAEGSVDHFPLPPDQAQQTDGDNDNNDNDNDNNDNNNEPDAASESVPSSRPPSQQQQQQQQTNTQQTKTKAKTKTAAAHGKAAPANKTKPAAANKSHPKTTTAAVSKAGKDKDKDKHSAVHKKEKEDAAKKPAPSTATADTTAGATDSNSNEPRPAIDREVAVLRIQLAVRRFVARRRVDHRRVARKSMQLHLARWIAWASVTIQRVVRGKLGRARFRLKHAEHQVRRAQLRVTSAVHIQRMLRGLHARRRIVPTKRLAKQEKDQHHAWIQSFHKKTVPDMAATGSGSSSDEKQASSSSAEAASKSSKSPVPKLDMPHKKKPSSAASKAAETKKQPSADGAGSPSKPGTANADAASAAAAVAGVAQDKLSEIDAKLLELAALERRIKESEALVQQQAQEATRKLDEQLKLMEEQAKKAEAERLAQQELLALAAGPISSRRSPYATITSTNLQKQQQQQQTSGTVSGMSTLMRTNGPPTGRSAKSGHYPPNAPRLTYAGQEWVQLWDYDENAYYWWCEATQVAQWEQPGMDPAYYYNTSYYAQSAATSYSSQQSTSVGIAAAAAAAAGSADDATHHNDDAVSVAYSESSAGAMTDVSMDQESTYFEDVDYATAAAQGWHEYWDESAQAKYWYNNNTGEASWTLPESLQQTRPVTTAPISARSGMNTAQQSQTRAAGGATTTSGVLTTQQQQQSAANNGWVSYLDEDTGQLYWHNVHTGEVRWDY